MLLAIVVLTAAASVCMEPAHHAAG
jgi:hypothetical protein